MPAHDPGRAIRLRFEGIARTYAGGTPPFTLRDVWLDVPPAGTLVVLGPSGSGKTTLLRVAAGLERPDRGRIRFDERDVTRVPPERRRVGVAFAQDALFPHLSSRRNIAYGVRSKDSTAVRDCAERLRVAHLLERNVRTLSGGERQRVALARAVACEPVLLLLDEPLSRLDAPLRDLLRRELGALFRERGRTSVLVTHDQSEAMALGDAIAVFRDGTLEQVGAPRAIFDRPANRFVASFVGTPAMSFVPAAALPELRVPANAFVGLRAEAIAIRSDGRFAGVVRTVEDFGSFAYAEIEIAAGTVFAQVGTTLPRAGEKIALELDFERAHVFDAAGDRIDLDTAHE